MTTASEQLQRILYILPAAHRSGGARLDELARALFVDVPTVLRDLEALTAREYYHPAGSSDTLCIGLEGDRVTLTTCGDFERPVRLNAREALAVQLGLRTLAAESDVVRRERLLALASRIEAELVAPEIETVHERRLLDALTVRQPDVEYDVEQEREILLAVGGDDLRGVLSDAVTADQPLRLQYLKPGAAEPEARHVVPQQVLYAEGAWYLAAYDLDRRDPRVFRLDRMLHAEPRPAIVPAVAHDRSWIVTLAERGAAYIAEADVRVTVRYAPAIARWVAERAGVPLEADGSAVVEHRVADPRWLLRHVLQFAGEAWVEQPEALREVVAQRALELSA